MASQDQPPVGTEPPSSEPTPDETVKPSEKPVHGQAVRSLISMLVDEPNVAQINRHQASTLRQLGQMKNRLANVNAKMSKEYSNNASEYLRAIRFASQIKSDLNDISIRLSTVKKTLAALDISTQSAPTPKPPPN